VPRFWRRWRVSLSSGVGDRVRCLGRGCGLIGWLRGGLFVWLVWKYPPPGVWRSGGFRRVARSISEGVRITVALVPEFAQPSRRRPVLPAATGAAGGDPRCVLLVFRCIRSTPPHKPPPPPRSRVPPSPRGRRFRRPGGQSVQVARLVPVVGLSAGVRAGRREGRSALALSSAELAREPSSPACGCRCPRPRARRQ
jgi:hypothetical protein